MGAIALNASTGLLSLAAAPVDLDAVRNCLNDIVADIERANKVIESVRAMFVQTREPGVLVGVNDIIGQTIALLRTELTAAGVQIELALAPDLPSITGHAGQLQQVFLNLAINATEAMMKISDRPRLLRIESRRFGSEGRRAAVSGFRNRY